ncbi:MAG: hypothetical protein ACYDH5_09405 [Acidimicrobiales bacterium]
MSEAAPPEARAGTGPSGTGGAHPVGVRQVTAVLSVLQTVIYYAVALVLVGIALIVLYKTGAGFAAIGQGGSLSLLAIAAINQVLFVIIVMELLSTVVSHVIRGGFQLRPFLIIGIISSVRRILLVGAQLSLNKAVGVTAFHDDLVELAVEASVVLVLTLSLALSRRVAGEADEETGA